MEVIDLAVCAFGVVLRCFVVPPTLLWLFPFWVPLYPNRFRSVYHRRRYHIIIDLRASEYMYKDLGYVLLK